MQPGIAFGGCVIVLLLKILPVIKPANTSVVLKPLKILYENLYLTGMMKCSRLQSSLRLFCRGVPVINTRWFVLNSIRALYKSESSFFSLCASSTIKAAQSRLPRKALSFSRISYVVRIALNFSLFDGKIHSCWRSWREEDCDWVCHNRKAKITISLEDTSPK